MPNAQIPMSVNTLDTATPIQQMGQQQNQNALTTEQTLKAHYENLDAREKSRYMSVMPAALQLKSYLDRNDIEGAKNFTMKRWKTIQGRIANGENIDDEDTRGAYQMLQEGRIDELKGDVDGVIAAGRVFGILDNDKTPSDWQTAELYRTGTDEQRKAFDATKRPQQFLDTGGAKVPVNPGGGLGTPIPMTPKPEDAPEYKRRQAEAAAQGTKAGEADAAATGGIQTAKIALQTFKALETSGTAAPSGALDNMGAWLSNKSGAGGAAAVAQGNFDSDRGAAESAARAVFRIVGSGADTERDAKPIIDMLPEASDAADVKAAKTAKSMKTLRERASLLAVERGLPDPFAGLDVGGGAGQPPAGVDPRLWEHMTPEERKLFQ